MTVKFQSNIQNSMIGLGLLSLMYIYGNGAQPAAVSVYSGVQPTSADITANWPAYNSGNANFLGHFINGYWSQPNNNSPTGVLLQYNPPAAQNAINTGTATWCIVWNVNVALVTVAGPTLPSAAFIVGPVSDALGQGIIRFTDPTTFVSGNPIAIADGSIVATSY